MNRKRGHFLPDTLGMKDLSNWFEGGTALPTGREWMKSLEKSPPVPVVEPPSSFLDLGKMETSKIKMTLKGLRQLALGWQKRKQTYPGLRAGGG